MSPFKIIGTFNAALVSMKAIRSVALYTLVSGAARLIGLVKESLIAKFFGVSAITDIYVMSLIIITFFVGPIAGAVNPALTTKIRVLHRENRLDVYGHLVSRVLVRCIVVIFCLNATTLLLYSTFTSKPQNFLHANFDNQHLVYFLMPTGLLSATTLILLAILAAKEKIKTLLLTPICVPLTIIIGCLIVPKSYLAPALFICTSLGYLIEMTIAFIFTKKYLHFFDHDPHGIQRGALSSLLKQWPTLIMSGFVMSACLVTDQTMAVLAGEGSVAVINFGNKVTLGIIALASVIWTVLFPKLIDMISERKFEQLAHYLTKLHMLLIVFGFIFFLALCLFSEIIITLLYERGEFSQSDTKIVSIIQAIYFLHIPFYVSFLICLRLFNAFEKPKHYLLANVLLLSLNVALNLLLINFVGVYGIPIATLLAYMCVTLLAIKSADELLADAKRQSPH